MFALASPMLQTLVTVHFKMYGLQQRAARGEGRTCSTITCTDKLNQLRRQPQKFPPTPNNSIDSKQQRQRAAVIDLHR